MTNSINKQQLKNWWDEVKFEVTNTPKINRPYPDDVVSNRELLLIAQCILERIENRENVYFHKEIYKIIRKQYYKQKAWLKI